ncbi:MAG: VCBS repeat-containing protein, partial [bacterium]|nr:VCBS repeat-containing protein [bacterium]
NFSKHDISTGADKVKSITTADVDGDGDIDVLSASYNDDKIAWYENDGSEGFTEHVITTGANGAQSVTTADIDGDGDLDVLSASTLDDTVAWYENDGSQGFTQHLVTAGAVHSEGARSVTTADMDGDGDLDVLLAAYIDFSIVWYENDGSETFTEHLVTSDADQAKWITTGDMDGDGDLDILSASFSDDTIAWYENTAVTTLDGTPTFIEGGAAVVLDADVDVSDVELDALNGGLGNYDGASVTLVRNGGANAEDIFSNSGLLSALTESGALVYNGTTIGTVTTNSGGTLVLTFNTNATSALVDSTLQSIAYSNTSDDPPASAQIDWSFDDGNTGSQGTGGALQAVGSTTVTITAVNDTPTLAASAANDTLTENTDTTSAAAFSTATIDPTETGDDTAPAQPTR